MDLTASHLILSKNCSTHSSSIYNPPSPPFRLLHTNLSPLLNNTNTINRDYLHPTPPVITDQLSFLPATILTIAAALSTEDREVLAYLIYCSSAATPPAFTGNPKRNTVKNTDHATLFNCSCFRCYTSYWVRWDESSNRELIHEIIDAFEEWLAQSNKGGKEGKGKKREAFKKLRYYNLQP